MAWAATLTARTSHAPPGLKLQGAIGKFGNVELSDVAAFVEMPDGKVREGLASPG